MSNNGPLANSVMLMVISRLAAAVGVPVAGALLYWAAGTFDAMRQELTQVRAEVRTTFKVQKVINEQFDKRINALEAKQ